MNHFPGYSKPQVCMGGVNRSHNEKRLLGRIWRVLRNGSPVGANKVHLLTTTALCCHLCELEMKSNTASCCLLYIAQVLDVRFFQSLWLLLCVGQLIQKM